MSGIYEFEGNQYYGDGKEVDPLPSVCLICGKQKGQPPERCNGHYSGTPSDPKLLPIAISFTQEEWTRVALALSVAQLEYTRSANSRGQKEADLETIARARKAGELCNRVCDTAGLDEIFRCEESK